MILNHIILKEYNDLLEKRSFNTKDERKTFLASLSDDYNTSPPADPSTPLGKALKLIEEAKYLDDSEGVFLAEKAAEIDPECIDAWNYLGEVEIDDYKSSAHYKKGIAIGKKKLSPDFFRENRGLFCSIPETRAYMRCLAGYASNLDTLKRFSEANQIYESMVALDIKDHHSMRHPLMLDLIRTDNIKKFKKYEARFVDDETIYMLFNRVPFYFKKTGDSKITIDLLIEANSRNRHFVPCLITFSKLIIMPDQEDKDLMFAWFYARSAKEYWIEVDGALNWLRNKGL
jgi:hypothetical protein